MRIKSVKIKNYRSHRCFPIELDDYTVLIGSNGAGKSSVLYALDWFFNDHVLDPSDVHRSADGEDEDRPVEVEVTFSDLTPEDQKALGPYGRADVACIRRTCVPPGKSKLLGASRQGPGFVEIRNAANAGERKLLFKGLPDDLGVSAAGTSEKDINDALDRWESENPDLLVDVPIDEAHHMHGFNGSGVLADLVNFVLIPASSDLAREVGGTTKGSALGDLVGELLNKAVTSARDTWQDAHLAEIERLEVAMREGVASATAEHERRINATLSEFVPDASLAFSAQMPQWRIQGDAALQTTIEIDGGRHDVARQGHGVQRAVMMAVLQTLAPDEGSAEGEPSSEGPALVVAIEEPEIYQHPIRARHFGRALTQLSGRPGTQVLLATHSPYFVRPEQFEHLRRVRLTNGVSTSTQATVAEVAEAAGESEEKVKRRLEVELPKTYSEGFFADAVVLVEGATDKAIIETIAERLGTPLDAAGIAVLTADGKRSLKLAAKVLEALGTRVLVVVDGDANGWTRRPEEKQVSAKTSHQKATDDVLAWIDTSSATFGDPPSAFGDGTAVGPNYWFLHDDIEHELEQWPEFKALCDERDVKLRDDKNASAYRAVAFDAGFEGLPPVLSAAVSAMLAMAKAPTAIAEIP